MTNDEARLLEALKVAVGDAHVLSDPGLLAAYETDWTGRFTGRARVVARPATTQEVVAVVRACADHGTPIVPQGGNTGLVGGAVPHDSAVVSLTRLHTVEAVDADSGQLTAGAGATLAAVQHAARAAGWDVPVDLAARDSATIGGMVATNAGGARVVRHGPMRACLAGVEAVFADGSTITRLAGLRKDNTGYDLAGLLCGSEGTLGILTRIRLRLVPLLPHRVTALFGVADASEAVEVVGRVRAAGVPLEAAEWFTADGVSLVREHTGLGPPPCGEHPQYLLVEAADASGPDDRLAASLAQAIAGDGGAADAAVASDRPGRTSLWAWRERHTEAIAAAGVPHKLDVAIPLDRFADFVDGVPAAVAGVDSRARAVLFGHVGDGNLHVNVLGLDPADERVDEAVLRLVAAHGGSVGAEHGIGAAKARWLHLSRSEAEVSAMRAIKRALDPRGLLNPGVLFPSPPSSPYRSVTPRA